MRFKTGSKECKIYVHFGHWHCFRNHSKVDLTAGLSVKTVNQFVTIGHNQRFHGYELMDRLRFKMTFAFCRDSSDGSTFARPNGCGRYMAVCDDAPPGALDEELSVRLPCSH